MSTTASAIMVEALASYGDIGIAAVKHIAELERENAALKSEVEFLHLRRGQLVIERDKAREALNDLVSWFVRPKLSGPVWMIAAGENGADGAVDAARAALAGSGEK